MRMKKVATKNSFDSALTNHENQREYAKTTMQKLQVAKFWMRTQWSSLAWWLCKNHFWKKMQMKVFQIQYTIERKTMGNYRIGSNLDLAERSATLWLRTWAVNWWKTNTISRFKTLVNISCIKVLEDDIRYSTDFPPGGVFPRILLIWRTFSNRLTFIENWEVLWFWKSEFSTNKGIFFCRFATQKTLRRAILALPT